MNNFFLICITTIIIGAIFLTPAFVIFFRMGKNRKPYHSIPPGIVPLSEPCELCHRKGQPGLTEQFVITKNRSRYMSSFYIHRSEEIAHTRASLCVQCYRENASTIANKINGNNPIAMIERWHNKNNPMHMETMFERIALEKNRKYIRNITKDMTISKKIFGPSYGIQKEKEWEKLVATHPANPKYDEYFNEESLVQDDSMKWLKKQAPTDIQYKEDPSIYGPIFKGFRQTMRQHNGIIQCRNCASMNGLSLTDIENDIRMNIEKQRKLESGRTVHIVLPDWTHGAVCPKCVAYFCNNCVQEAFQHKSESRDQVLRVLSRYVPSGTPRELFESDLTSTQHTVLCPKCQDVFLLGIDHITD